MIGFKIVVKKKKNYNSVVLFLLIVISLLIFFVIDFECVWGLFILNLLGSVDRVSGFVIIVNIIYLCVCEENINYN